MLALIKILDLLRSTVTELPKFWVFPLTFMRSLRKVSYFRQKRKARDKASQVVPMLMLAVQNNMQTQEQESHEYCNVYTQFSRVNIWYLLNSMRCNS